VPSAVLYVADLMVGFSLPLVVHLRQRGAGQARIVRRLFWLGVAIGLAWEVPIFLSAILAASPVVVFLESPPLHPLWFMLSHSFWDGGLFLAGVLLLRAAFGATALQRFRWAELGVFVLWGQASELLVEITSVTGGLWAYVGTHPWNPVLFEWRGHPITLLPQLIWLAAPVVYYPLAVLLVRPRPSPWRSSAG
jgi:hypothetical protein